MKNIPNILTITRILIIPLIIISFYICGNIKISSIDYKLSNIIGALLFLIACITDFLDGFLARKLSLHSNLGRLLDPIADKLLVGATILMLVHFDRASILPSIAIICREILVSGLREFLAEVRVSIPVSNLAKFKTFLQMLAIFILLFTGDGSGVKELDFLGNIALWLAAGLTIITGYVYLKASLKHISSRTLV
jgi:cardiolipin synthase (CMP-forming)